MRTSEPFSFDAPVDHLADALRVAAIDETGLATVRADTNIDRLTSIAQWGTGAPVALVTLVEPTRQVFVSAWGLPRALDEARESPLSHSFCQYVVANDAPLVVDDARSHPVLAHHAGLLVNGIVAYAGHPVRHPDGTVIGTLCAADFAPREWTSADVAALAELAAVLETEVHRRVRRRAAERLQRRLQSVMDGATSTAIIAADPEGVITFANKGAADLFGLTPEELVEQRLPDLSRHWTPASGGGTPDGAEDWFVTDGRGEERVVTVRRTALRDGDGRVCGSMVICDDVSARVRAEEMLSETVRKQEAVVEQMRTLDHARTQFIATASHELRTPVSSILGYTELLLDGTAGAMSSRQVDFLQRVVRNAERLLSLSGDLLTLARAEAGGQPSAWTTLDVGAVADQAWEASGPHLLGRDLRFEKVRPFRPAVVRGDAMEIERIITNLLLNAVKYTPDGGAVELDVRHAGESVEVVVADTGVGIDLHDQERVFEPFYRAHEAQRRAVPGAGLGLALVRRLTEAHGGSVGLESRPGEGTTVTVSLPVRPEVLASS